VGPSFNGWALFVSAHSFQLPLWTYGVYVGAVSAVAIWKGGPSERVGAGLIFGGWVATTLVWRIPGAEPASGIAIVDLMVLAGLVALALRSHRYWPLFAAGFQLLAIITYWAHVLDPTLGGWAFLTAGILWGYLLVGALGVGALNAWRNDRPPAADDPVAAQDAIRR
jgi:hypothetical protein